MPVVIVVSSRSDAASMLQRSMLDTVLKSASAQTLML
jgi:hypothetical protein